MAILRESETSVHTVKNANIAVYNMPLETNMGETHGTVLIKNAEDLMAYTKGEEEAMEKFVKGLVDARINVVVSSGSLSEICLHYLEKHKIMALKILSKHELRRIAKSVGAYLLTRMEAPVPDEMGTADEVTVKEIGSQKVTVISRDERDNRVATILLRGSTKSLLDDSERAIDDGINTVKAMVRDRRFCAGAGATEIHIASQIQTYAKTQPGLDQYAVEKFGEAFEIVPRTLAENAGHKAEELIAKLYSETAKSPFYGIDVDDGKVKDMKEQEVFDSIEVKSWAVKLAIDAVLTVLKVDQIIMSKPAGGPAPRKPGPWDDQD